MYLKLYPQPYRDDEPGEESGAGTATQEQQEPPQEEPSQETPPEPESEPEPSESEPEQEVTLRGLLQERGIEVGEDDDDFTLVDKLTNSHQQSQEYQRRLQEMEQQLRQRDQFYQQQLQQLQYQQQQPQGQPPQQQPQPPDYNQAKILKHWQNVPEFDPKWENLLQRDEQGNLVAVPGADPTLPQKYKQALEWQRQVLNEQLQNPHDFAYESLVYDPDQRLQRDVWNMVTHAVGQFQNQLQSQQQYQQQQSAVENILSQESDWMFETDLNGNVTGMTPEGQQYEQLVGELQQSGVTDPQRQHYFAKQMLESHLGRKLGEKRSASEERNKRNLNLQKEQARRSTRRGGSLSNNERSPAQNQALDLEEMLNQNLRKEGF